MAFQVLIANIALLVLIIALATIGVIMYRGKNKFIGDDVIIGECPDYWVINKDTNGTYCKNVKNLGKQTCPKQMNFGVSPWSNYDGSCKKKNWAESCDLTWDGLTNNPYVCNPS